MRCRRVFGAKCMRGERRGRARSEETEKQAVSMPDWAEQEGSHTALHIVEGGFDGDGCCVAVLLLAHILYAIDVCR